MIRLDRKVCRAALKLSKKSYDAILQYDSVSGELQSVREDHSVIASIKLKIDPDDVELSIERLIEKGFFEVYLRHFGGLSFSITPLLKHRSAFMLDAFSKRFWGGFITGVLTATAANLLTGYVQELISKAVQWLSRLL